MSEQLTVGTNHHLTLMPKSGLRHDFVRDTLRVKRSIWLVPHVKHRDDAEMITCRYSRGQPCESGCLYAMS